MSVAGPLRPIPPAGVSRPGAPRSKTSQDLKTDFLTNPSNATAKSEFLNTDGHGLSKAGKALLESIDFTNLTAGSNTDRAKLALNVAQRLDDSAGQNTTGLQDYIINTTPIPTESTLNTLLGGAPSDTSSKTTADDLMDKLENKKKDSGVDDLRESTTGPGASIGDVKTDSDVSQVSDVAPESGASTAESAIGDLDSKPAPAASDAARAIISGNITDGSPLAELNDAMITISNHLSAAFTNTNGDPKQCNAAFFTRLKNDYTQMIGKYQEALDLAEGTSNESDKALIDQLQGSLKRLKAVVDQIDPSKANEYQARIQKNQKHFFSLPELAKKMPIGSRDLTHVSRQKNIQEQTQTLIHTTANTTSRNEVSAGTTATIRSDVNPLATIGATGGSPVTSEASGGSSVATEESGGSTIEQSAGGSSVTTESSGGSTIEQSAGGSSVTTESSGGSSVATEESGGSTIEQSAGGSSVTTESSGVTPSGDASSVPKSVESGASGGSTVEDGPPNSIKSSSDSAPTVSPKETFQKWARSIIANRQETRESIQELTTNVLISLQKQKETLEAQTTALNEIWSGGGDFNLQDGEKSDFLTALDTALSGYFTITQDGIALKIEPKSDKTLDIETLAGAKEGDTSLSDMIESGITTAKSQVTAERIKNRQTLLAQAIEQNSTQLKDGHLTRTAERYFNIIQGTRPGDPEMADPEIDDALGQFLTGQLGITGAVTPETIKAALTDKNIDALDDQILAFETALISFKGIREDVSELFGAPSSDSPKLPTGWATMNAALIENAENCLGINGCTLGKDQVMVESNLATIKTELTARRDALIEQQRQLDLHTNEKMYKDQALALIRQIPDAIHEKFPELSGQLDPPPIGAEEFCKIIRALDEAFSEVTPENVIHTLSSYGELLDVKALKAFANTFLSDGTPIFGNTFDGCNTLRDFSEKINTDFPSSNTCQATRSSIEACLVQLYEADPRLCAQEYSDNFKAVIGTLVIDASALARANQDFLEPTANINIDQEATHLARCEASMSNDAFRSQSVALIARFLNDNPRTSTLSEQPKLSYLAGKLTPDDQNLLGLFSALRGHSRDAKRLLSTCKTTLDRQAALADFKGKGLTEFGDVCTTVFKNDLNGKKSKNFYHYLKDYMGNSNVKGFSEILLKIQTMSKEQSPKRQQKQFIEQALKGTDLTVDQFNKAIGKLEGTDAAPAVETHQDGVYQLTRTAGSNDSSDGDSSAGAPSDKITAILTQLDAIKMPSDPLSSAANGIDANSHANELFSPSAGASGGKVSLGALNVSGLGVTDLKRMDTGTTIATVKQELQGKTLALETAFNDQFGPVFGNISLNDVLEIFKAPPGGDHRAKFLDTMDETSQQIFMQNILYPAATMDIQLKALADYENTQTIGDAQSSLKFVGSPALPEQLADFSTDTIQNLVALSYHGLDPSYGGRPPSLLGVTQLDALQKMERSYTDGKPQAVKLGAGEGKTFLSVLFSNLFDLGTKGNPPIIHIAPFAQDETGWVPLPRTGEQIDFSKMAAGQHYWVRADQMATAVDALAIDTASHLKEAMIFCDEYDRYPELNSNMDSLGCFKRCNMSATDNLQEVNVKIGEKAHTFTALQTSLPSESTTLKELTTMVNAPDSFDHDDFIVKTNALISSIDAQPEVLTNDKLQYARQKIVKLQSQIPALIARRVDQMDAEFNGRDMTIATENGGCADTLTKMLLGCQTGDGKKNLLCFQGAEFVADGHAHETGREGIHMSTLQSTLQGLYTDGEPVYVHMSAPKGMSGFKEGHPITMSFNGSEWSIKDFNDFERRTDVDTQGTHVCLYDTFNKVGGDFKRFSNEAHYQACQIDNKQSGEPTTKSLLYQMARRNRTGKLEGGRTRCGLTVFMSSTDQQNAAVRSPSDKDILLTSLSTKEAEFNQTALQERHYQKRGNKLNKLFDHTATQWLQTVKENGASDTILEQLKTNITEYKEAKHIGLKLASGQSFDATQTEWNTAFNQFLEAAKTAELTPMIEAAGITAEDYAANPDFPFEKLSTAATSLLTSFYKGKNVKGTIQDVFFKPLNTPDTSTLNLGFETDADQRLFLELLTKSMSSIKLNLNFKPSAGAWKEITFNNRVGPAIGYLEELIYPIREAKAQQSGLKNVPVSIDQNSYEYKKAIELKVFT